MQEIVKKIYEILEKLSITQDFIDEIIVKNLENAIISINLEKVPLKKNEIEIILKKAENNIKTQLNFQKVTIFLTSNAVSQKNNNKKPKNNQKQQKSLNIFEKVANFFKKPAKKPEKNNINSQKPQINIKTNHEKPKEIQKVVGVKKIIAVASGKGGVGKSSFAVNLAASLKKIGHKVAIVDADIYGPSIPSLMNLKTKPEVKNNLLIPLISNGIKTMSMGFMMEKDSAGVWRGPMITKILYQLIRSVNWAFDNEEVDFMIIDMPPGTGDIYLSLAQNFPVAGVVIVSTPHILAIDDVVRCVDCFEKLQIPILGIVQNMAYLENENCEKQYIFGKDNAKIMAQKYQLKFLGDIPLNQEISDSCEDGIPFVIKNSASKISHIFGHISEKIIDKM